MTLYFCKMEMQFLRSQLMCMSKRLPPVPKREFEAKLKENGFHKDRNNGGHTVWERTQSISIPIHDKEINGGMARRLTKEFHLEKGK